MQGQFIQLQIRAFSAIQYYQQNQKDQFTFIGPGKPRSLKQKMEKQQSEQENEFQIIIVECCQNCESHQSFTRHSQWKYFQQFNELKHKIQKFVPNAIVIKNPIPDQLHKPQQVKLDKNAYINRITKQKIFYPRIGAFEIYISNVLISSKLMSTSWPNHYKVLRTLNQILVAKKQGLKIDGFSIYNGGVDEVNRNQVQIQKAKENPYSQRRKQSPQLEASKNKLTKMNGQKSNRFRVYRTKQQRMNQSMNEPTNQSTTNHSTTHKNSLLQPLQRQRVRVKKISSIITQEQTHRLRRIFQYKQQAGVKLPSLRNSINVLASKQYQTCGNNDQSIIQQASLQQQDSRPLFNSIDEAIFGKGQVSLMQRDDSLQFRLMEGSITSAYDIPRQLETLNRFDSLVLGNNDDSILGPGQHARNASANSQSNINKQSSPWRKSSNLSKNNNQGNQSQNHPLISNLDGLPSSNLDGLPNLADDEQELTKYLQNRSVQYSHNQNNENYQQLKQLMDKSIQYQYQSQASEQRNNGSKMPKQEVSPQKQFVNEEVQTQKVDFQYAQRALPRQKEKQTSQFMVQTDQTGSQHAVERVIQSKNQVVFKYVQTDKMQLPKAAVKQQQKKQVADQQVQTDKVESQTFGRDEQREKTSQSCSPQLNNIRSQQPVKIQQKPKQIEDRFVQTNSVKFNDSQNESKKQTDKVKPEMMDSSNQTCLSLNKDQINLKNQQMQKQKIIPVKKIETFDSQTNTQQKYYTDRCSQFPDEALTQSNQQREQHKDQKNKVSILENKQIQIQNNSNTDGKGQKSIQIGGDDWLKLEEELARYKQKQRQLGKQNQELKLKLQQKQKQEQKQRPKTNQIQQTKQNSSLQQFKRKVFLESMVFAVYNFFGIKTPQKRLSSKLTVSYKGKTPTYSSQDPFQTQYLVDPQIRHLSQFQEFDAKKNLFPLSQQLTFKGSNKKVKFTCLGKILALIYFLDDRHLLSDHSNNKNTQAVQNKPYSNLGLVIANQQVKQIHCFNCQNYQLYNCSQQDLKAQKLIICFNSLNSQLSIDPKGLSRQVKLQFVEMLSHIASQKTFKSLNQYLNNIYLHKSRAEYQKVAKLKENFKLHYPSQQDQRYYKNQSEFLKDLLQNLLQKLQTRLVLIRSAYKGQIYIFGKYKSLEASISFNLRTQPLIKRRLIVKKPYSQNHGDLLTNNSLQNKNVIRVLTQDSQMIFIQGQGGSGKSCFLVQLKRQLQSLEKCNILYLNQIQAINNLNQYLDQKFHTKKRNIMLIDNINDQKRSKRLIELVRTLSEQKQNKYDVSYLCVISNTSLLNFLTYRLDSLVNKNKFKKQKFLCLNFAPLTTEDKRSIISKFTDSLKSSQKEQYVNTVVRMAEDNPILENILYLKLFCRAISKNDLDSFTKDLCKYKIGKWLTMKKTFQKCQLDRKRQLQQMDIQQQAGKDLYCQLRQLVLRLHLLQQSPLRANNQKKIQVQKQVRKESILQRVQQGKLQLIEQFLNRFKQGKQGLIRSHLCFYPIDLDFITRQRTNKNIATTDHNQNYNHTELQGHRINIQQLFLHPQFYNYLLVQAFVYYAVKGFGNLGISHMTQSPDLLQIMRQKAQHQTSFYQQLIRVVHDTQQFPSLSQQGSNAMTLLCSLGYQFSNVVFDHCQLQKADLSLTTFYNCSFRNTNLSFVKLYKTSFLSCAIDSTFMEDISLLVKKYQIEFTPMCCAISHDSRQIALGCGNYLIVIAAQTGKQIKKLQAHLDVIRCVKYSKDGNKLITIADDKTLRSWDTKSFSSVVFKLSQKGGAIHFSTQSQTIAAVVNKSQLKVWNMKSMGGQTFLQGHSQQITTVSFSQNGEYILTGSRDSSVRLWNLKGKQLHIYEGHQKQILCVKMSSNNGTVASSSRQKLLILFNTLAENIIARKQFLNEITQICLDLKEKYIVVAFSQQKQISILNFSSLQIVHKLQGHKQRVLSINFDLNNQKLISLSKDRTVRLWDLDQIMRKQETLLQIKQATKCSSGPIFCIACNQLSDTYATGHSSGQINIWNDRNNQIIHKLIGHQGSVNRIQFDSTTGKLYSGGKDGILRIWDINAFTQSSFKQKKQPQKRIQLFSVQFIQLRINEINRLIVMTSSNSQLIVYNLQEQMRMILTTRDQGMVNAVTFNQNNKLMSIGGGQKYIITYTMQNQGNNLVRSTKKLGEHPEEIILLAYQGDDLLISVLKSGHIYIWNHLKFTLIKKIQNMSPISCLSIYNKKYACISSQDGKIRIINLDLGKQVKIFKYKQMCNQFVTKKGGLPLLYAGCKDGNVLKWNLQGLQKMSASSVKSSNSPPPLMLQQKAIKFGRKAVNERGSLMIQIQGQKTINVKNLHQHTEQLIKAQNCPSIIQGVEFINDDLPQDKDVEQNDSLRNIVLLLKSGQLWSLSSQSIYSKPSQDSSRLQIHTTNFEGDLFYIKEKQQLFFKSNIKKMYKQMKAPTQAVVDEVTIGG